MLQENILRTLPEVNGKFRVLPGHSVIYHLTFPRSFPLEYLYTKILPSASFLLSSIISVGSIAPSISVNAYNVVGGAL